MLLTKNEAQLRILLPENPKVQVKECYWVVITTFFQRFLKVFLQYKGEAEEFDRVSVRLFNNRPLGFLESVDSMSRGLHSCP